ncbi:hypothetical protein ACX3PU_03445 [Chryseobacterium sp. A301]
MKKSILYLVILIVCTSCSKKQLIQPISTNDTTQISDFNIIIAPDLSNRINPAVHPKPVNDTLIIAELVDNIQNILLINHRQLNQEDSYKFDFINRGVLNQNLVNPNLLFIDFSKFKGQPGDLVDYVRKYLKTDVTSFKRSVGEVYNNALENPSGSDIWNYINESISLSLSEQSISDITPENNPPGDPILIKKKENVLILITDGYIENINSMPKYTFNQRNIQEIRENYRESGLQDLESFILSNPDYHLKPTKNTLAGVNVLVLELYDRSLDVNGVAKFHPTDYQIMKVVWEKWLKDSGAKNVKLAPLVTKKEEVFPILNTFLSSIK